MKAEKLIYSQTKTRSNHHSDALPSFPVDTRRRKELRRIEEASTSKYNSSTIAAGGLAAELRKQLRGEVRFDDGSRALYATDGSNYRQVPIGVVVPSNADDVVATVAPPPRV